ncbi:hypothetical protein [Streptomyces sp. NPDC086776]|uniref:hypothetical protein n=1 Tax=Streptomyces sp. NPDC086776 TaxID=3365756 RepID=UPI00382F7831
MSSTVVNGWTIVTQTRQEVSPNHFQGVFLATGRGGHWVAGRHFDGKKGSTGFSECGEWWHGSHFTLGNPTENMLAALEAYPELAMKAAVWHRLFEQTAAQTLCRFLAGPRRDDLPLLSAGWRESDAGHRLPAAGSTIALPFHEAKYQLFWYLHSTRLGAKAHLTEGVTIDRHEAYTRVRDATGPLRFELGYNTYWLDKDDAS